MKRRSLLLGAALLPLAAAAKTPTAPLVEVWKSPTCGCCQLWVEILERDGFLCRYCGGPANTVDHVVPVERGGSHDPLNLVAACSRCNESKGAKTLQEWRPDWTEEHALRERLRR